jgi:hypothetical protein
MLAIGQSHPPFGVNTQTREQRRDRLTTVEPPSLTLMFAVSSPALRSSMLPIFLEVHDLTAGFLVSLVYVPGFGSLRRTERASQDYC